MGKNNKLKYLDNRIYLAIFSFSFITVLTIIISFLIMLERINNQFWPFVPLILFITLLVICYFTIYKPYQVIKHIMELFGDGYGFIKFSDVKIPFCKEFESLDKRLKILFDSDTLMNASKRQAQYLALQNQINPHFLYNTLEGIRSEALVAGCKSIASMTEALSTFFRYTISHVENFVSLDQELNNTRNYFFIQQYRFGPNLQLKINFASDVDQEETLLYRIPKLTLQPIVENAIIHGLEKKVGLGTVTISIEVFNERLLITVSDNGCGMNENTLAKLRKKLSTKTLENLNSDSKKGGIALINVNHRIMLLFGVHYGLDIMSTKGIGTDVTISLPRKITTGEGE